ncbi:uncharacterized protein LOC110631555 isoform X2 [Hevea brasiliensis]|nr:uncharacterized protein LOC110631555 isoform X2 [Hevea brasiliensis]
MCFSARQSSSPATAPLFPNISVWFLRRRRSERQKSANRYYNDLLLFGVVILLTDKLTLFSEQNSEAMDDSCAVCAETLKWVAYGPCGHREVCSTCTIRLRFICNDQCCCICKSESSIIFVTKALGDYTRMVNDFSAFPANPIEGQVGQYWFHEGARAYFDDLDHYKMIKAMCRLSCNVCDRKNEPKSRRSKRTGDFNCIEQLKIHLFHQHRLFMCSLCLEGRKIFISEQKLYNRAQLNQHVKTGDSVVDGSESERGGFMGHPMCEFCQNPSYGDNELYLHMSTEHFTCHICQKQHPGRYEYFNDYDDLEIHFRQGHFLCEDEACLAKKFIVFAAESEMKRHDAMEHGGRMSRAKRNAALLIPTSFQYRQSCEHDDGNHPRSSDIQLSMAEDSRETFNAVRFHDISLNAQTSHRETSEIKSTVNPFEPLAGTDSEPSSSYCLVLGHNSTRTLLEESSFPPLPMAPRISVQRSRNAMNGLSGNTMAAHLRHQNTVEVLNCSRASPAASHYPSSSGSISYHSRPVLDSGLLSSSSSQSSSQSKPAATNEYALSGHESSIQSGPSAANDLVLSSSFASSSRTQSSTSKVYCSSSAQNLVDRETHDKSFSDPQVDKLTTSSKLLLKAENVESANKALVEKIRAALDFDRDKYAAFKVISVEYRQDLIDTGEYLAYVHQFGLSHLVLELAMLCPNAQKQRELVEIYKYNTRRNGSNENGLSIVNDHSKSKKSSKKGKEKCEDNGIYLPENALAENGTSASEMMNLQLNHKPSLDEAKISSKVVCHSGKGKSKILVEEQQSLNSLIEPRNNNDTQSGSGCPEKNVGARGGNKSHKKMSKFLKNRLGDISAAQLLDKDNPGAGPDGNDEKTCWKKNPPEMLPIHGVWHNGGGRRLVVMTQRRPKKVMT